MRKYFLLVVLAFALSAGTATAAVPSAPSLWKLQSGNLSPIQGNYGVVMGNATTTHLVVTGSCTGCGVGGSGNSAFTIGNGLIYNATSTDAVGIGTTTPSGYSLVVSPPLNSALNLFYAASSTGQGLVISNAGNVGIGTTTPGSFLTVGGGTNTTAGRGVNFGDATADLYRSAAGIVKTDGALTVQGTLTVQTQINSGTNLTVNLATPAANTNGITFQTNSNIVAASGVVGGLKTGFNFVPASGSGSFNGLMENDGINQAPIVSQTASTTGILINPNLVRAMDYRALVTAPYTWNLATTTTLSQAYGSLFNAYTLATTSATTITNAGNIVISGAPIASSSSITITSSTALTILGNSVVKNSGVVSNAYGLWVAAPTSAAKNYAAAFFGNFGIGTSTPANAGLTITAGDVYITDQTKGIILKDTVSGTCYRVQMTSGVLTPSSLTCP